MEEIEKLCEIVSNIKIYFIFDVFLNFSKKKSKGEFQKEISFIRLQANEKKSEIVQKFDLTLVLCRMQRL